MPLPTATLPISTGAGAALPRRAALNQESRKAGTENQWPLSSLSFLPSCFPDSTSSGNVSHVSRQPMRWRSSRGGGAADGAVSMIVLMANLIRAEDLASGARRRSQTSIVVRGGA